MELFKNVQAVTAKCSWLLLVSTYYLKLHNGQFLNKIAMSFNDTRLFL